MGKKLDTVLETARLLGASISHVSRIAANQLSERMPEGETWPAPMTVVQRLLHREKSASPQDTSNADVDKAASAGGANNPDNAAPPTPTTASVSEETLDAEPDALSSNPWIDMLSPTTRQ